MHVAWGKLKALPSQKHILTDKAYIGPQRQTPTIPTAEIHHFPPVTTHL